MNEPNPTTDELAMFLENEAAKILEIAACFEEDGSKVEKPYAQAAARLRELEEDKALLDALLNPAWPKPATQWPYKDTRGTYEPPFISWRWRNASDGFPVEIPAPKTRKDLRAAIDAARAR